MERLIVKQFLIVSLKQQLLFQIRLPRDSKRIIGVLATASATKSARSQTEVGWLWLSTPKMGETLFCDTIQVKPKDFGITGLPQIGQPGYDNGSLTVSGTKIEFNYLDRPITDTIVEGFYSNQQVMEGKYLLTVYLKIEV